MKATRRAGVLGSQEGLLAVHTMLDILDQSGALRGGGFDTAVVGLALAAVVGHGVLLVVPRNPRQTLGGLCKDIGVARAERLHHCAQVVLWRID